MFEECHGVAAWQARSERTSKTAHTKAAASFLWVCKGATVAVGTGLDLLSAWADGQFQGCKAALLLLNAEVAGVQCRYSSNPVRSQAV